MLIPFFSYFKARSVFNDVSPEVAYDVLQDIDYRSRWDKYMIGTEPIGYLNPTNDIYYYVCMSLFFTIYIYTYIKILVGSLPPFKSRDFVMQRSWLDTGAEKYLCAHSVWHDVKFYKYKNFQYILKKISLILLENYRF